MRLFAPILLLAVVAPHSASAGTGSADHPGDIQHAVSCGETKSEAQCGVSRRELDQAKSEFERGLELRKQGKMAEALAAFQAASRLVPRDVEYASAREIVRQQLVMEYVQRGNALMEQKRAVEAVAAFQQALQLDSGNTFARERLQQALETTPRASGALRVVEGGNVVELLPRRESKSFHLKGNARALLEQVAAAYGVRAVVDESVKSRPVRFDIEDVDFATAVEALGKVTQSFYVPLSAREVLVAADTREQHQQYDRMLMRTFYFPDTTAPTELNDLVNALRTIFDVRFVVAQTANNSLAIRAPQASLDAGTRFIEMLDAARPQVMLQMEVYEVSRSMARNFGLDLPLQWQAFNVGQAALAALQQPNVRDLINQLFASGAINQANSTALTALLAQLQSQQNQLLRQPFGTFGGGSTLFAVPFPPAHIKFSLNDSFIRSLERISVRTAQGNPATLRIGSRFPILNATFAPIFNTGAISQVIQSGSFIAPFPSFTYEDLGISVKTTPQVHKRDVTLELEVEIKALGTQNFNGVPIISNRVYKGAVRVTDGQPGVVAGTLDRQEQNVLTGIPGIAQVPGLNAVLANRSRQQSDSELLIVVTPHIVRLPPSAGEAVVLRSSP